MYVYLPEHSWRLPIYRRRRGDHPLGRLHRPWFWSRRFHCHLVYVDCQYHRRCWSQGPCYPWSVRSPSTACVSVGVHTENQWANKTLIEYRKEGTRLEWKHRECPIKTSKILQIWSDVAFIWEAFKKKLRALFHSRCNNESPRN